MDDRFEFLDPKLLCLFDLIHSTGSVTRAAEQLGQSQPTVSIWLAKLRVAFQDPLFVRTPRGMLPTPRADALIGTVREALDSLRHISQLHGLFDPASARRRVHLSMTDAGDITMLPRILAHLSQVAPEISIEAVRIGVDTGRQLASGEVDLALGLVPELDSGFYQQALYEEDWVCLCGADHPRARSISSLGDYEQEAHIAITTRTGALLNAAIARQRIKRNVVLELPGFLGLPTILSGSCLLATLPRGIGEALARSAGLTVFPSPVQAPTLTIKQYWHERYHQDPVNRWLRSMCAGLFAGRGVSPVAVTGH